MEFLNKVELIGIVGNLRVQQYGENKITRLSLLTNYAYTNSEGHHITDTTWHNVVAPATPKTADAAFLQKGDAARVIGRIRLLSYTDQYGNDKNIIEIAANSVEKINEQLTDYEKA